MSANPIFILPDHNGTATTTASRQPWSPAQEPIRSVPTAEFLITNFSMAELNAIHDHLWIAGSRGNISALHHQRVLLRDIIPSELARLHLVWFERTIYIKPLPDGLLDDSLCFREGFDPSGSVVGFLRSYCSLIQYPIDLAIAKETNLISKNVEWKEWANFRKATFTKTEEFHLNRRYTYGELRLDRLDIIYRLTFRGLSYFTVHRTYKTYFAQYLSLFATSFAFVAIVLTAMQVLVAVPNVPETVTTTSYRFSVAVLVAVSVCFGYILLVFLFMVLYNLVLAWLAHSGDKASSS